MSSCVMEARLAKVTEGGKKSMQPQIYDCPDGLVCCVEAAFTCEWCLPSCP
ncbi:hypothetical protein LINPERHAP1_LOCUS36164 [Linum perenne]